MTTHTAARPSRGVRVGTHAAGLLLIVGAMLMMTLSGWPGLIKLAGILGVTLGFVARENWRHPERMTAGTPWVGLAAVPVTALVAVAWPALPGEQVATVAIVAGCAVVYCAASLLARYHSRQV